MMAAQYEQPGDSLPSPECPDDVLGEPAKREVRAYGVCESGTGHADQSSLTRIEPRHHGHAALQGGDVPAAMKLPST
jgi:hypothetical protein